MAKTKRSSVREKTGLSQLKFATLLGVSRSDSPGVGTGASRTIWRGQNASDDCGQESWRTPGCCLRRSLAAGVMRR